MIKVGVVGATGYTGSELLRLLSRHPDVQIQVVTSRSEKGKAVADLFPNLRGHIKLKFTDPEIAELEKCTLVFFATPNGTAMTMVPTLLAAGVKVIDMSADFRLKDVDTWVQWYGQPHSAPDLLAEAVYGLSEINRDDIRKASLVANPGCYPTAIILSLVPMLESGCIDVKSIIADAKSGISGAGRKISAQHLFAECSESFKAYNVTGHRHQPEICQVLNNLVSDPVSVTFVPHLVPMIRGIHATVYARLQRNVDLQKMYEDRYINEPFVDVMPAGSHPETRSVRGSNFCRMAVHKPDDGNTVIVLSVIDNLVKGAAGQAIQNMNLMFGLDETTGLQNAGMMP